MIRPDASLPTTWSSVADLGHDLGITTNLGVGIDIFRAPAAQHQPCRRKHLSPGVGRHPGRGVVLSNGTGSVKFCASRPCRTHSIVRSTRASSSGGIVSVSAFAVLRLTTSYLIRLPAAVNSSRYPTNYPPERASASPDRSSMDAPLSSRPPRDGERSSGIRVWLMASGDEPVLHRPVWNGCSCGQFGGSRILGGASVRLRGVVP